MELDKNIELGDGVPIDKEMIPLINELNRAGLKTTQCCSGHGKRKAYISIRLDNVIDIAVREKGTRLVIWWKQ